MGPGGDRRYRRAAGAHRRRGGGHALRPPLRRGRGQPVRLRGPLRELREPPGRRPGPVLPLRRRQLDRLLRPAGGAHLQPRAGAHEPSGGLVQPSGPRLAGADRLHQPCRLRLQLHRPGHASAGPAQQRGRAQRLLRQPPGPGAPRLRGRGGRGGRGRLRHRRDPGGDCPQGRPGWQRHRHSLSRGGHQRPPRRHGRGGRVRPPGERPAVHRLRPGGGRAAVSGPGLPATPGPGGRPGGAPPHRLRSGLGRPCA